MEVNESEPEQFKAFTNPLDKKFDRTIRAIKEVGFPIVAFLLIFFVGYRWGDRIITSQENFVHEVKDEIREQTKNTDRILNAQEQETIHEENQTKIMERQLQLLEDRLEENKK